MRNSLLSKDPRWAAGWDTPFGSRPARAIRDIDAKTTSWKWTQSAIWMKPAVAGSQVGRYRKHREMGNERWVSADGTPGIEDEATTGSTRSVAVLCAILSVRFGLESAFDISTIPRSLIDNGVVDEAIRHRVVGILGEDPTADLLPDNVQ
jgi:hypothetical protein